MPSLARTLSVLTHTCLLGSQDWDVYLSDFPHHDRSMDYMILSEQRKAYILLSSKLEADCRSAELTCAK